MSLDVAVITVTLLVMLVALVREWARPVVVFLLALGLFVVAGLIEPEQAFAGFSNDILITIGGLFVITRVVEQSSGFEKMIRKIMGRGTGPRRALLRIMAPVVLFSGFLNNTPVVSMLVPQVGRWASQHKLAASRFLMPLSFAAILGGTLTLIGTSTNLAVSGLLSEYGYEPFGFFDIAIVGAPLALLGIVFVSWAAPKLLPVRTSAFDSDGDAREFICTAEAGKGLNGKTVGGAKLRNMSGVFLYAVERSGEVISPVTPVTRLHEGDLLHFAGKADSFRLLDKIDGLKTAGKKHVARLNTDGDLSYSEVVIDGSSPIVGRTLKEAGFRGRYNAAVVAIHRGGERVQAKLGSVRLRAGDTLLVIADEQFAERWAQRKDFLAVFPLGILHTRKRRHGVLTAAILAAALALAISGVVSLAVAIMLAAACLVAARIISFDEARRSIDIEILVLIAAAFGVASAVSASGVASSVAEALTDTLGVLGPIGVLAGIVIATIILTELVTNSAAALLMLPIAISAAVALGVDPRMMAIAVAIAASASFLSPIGYQTNTMVYGPGGYKFTDYARLGWLPTLIVVVLLLGIIPLVW